MTEDIAIDLVPQNTLPIHNDSKLIVHLLPQETEFGKL
jgi:hypothetical protein